MLFIAFHVNVWWGTCCSSLFMLMFGGVRVAHRVWYVLFIALHVKVWWGTCCSSLFMLMFGGVRVVHRFSC